MQLLVVSENGMDIAEDAGLGPRLHGRFPNLYQSPAP
jgi:hypothetical protein